MAVKVEKTFEQIMAMLEDEFFDFVKDNGHSETVKRWLTDKTEQKQYPRVLKPSKKNPAKMTYQADKTATPTIVLRPITFFEIKSRYCFKVLKLDKIVKKKKETFRERHMND